MIRTQDIPEDNDWSRNRSHRCENKLAIEKTPVHAPRAIDKTVTIERIIALGEEQGQVKFNDVMLMFPQVKENLDLLEDVYDALLSAGIPYSDNGLVRRKKQGKTPAEEGKPGVNLGGKSPQVDLWVFRGRFDRHPGEEGAISRAENHSRTITKKYI